MAAFEPFREAFVAMAIMLGVSLIYGNASSANLVLQSIVTRSVVA
jgi:hypothetical protein